MDTGKPLSGANEISGDFLDSVSGGKCVLERISKEDAGIILEAQKQTEDKSLMVVVGTNGLFYKVKEV